VKQIAHAAVVGIVAFAVAEGGWLILRRFTGDSSRWVLEPTIGLLFAGAILFAALVWLGLRAGAPRPGITGQGCVAYCAVCLSITALLFVIGPGNIWPIVLVIDYAIVAVFILTGWGVGRLIARLRSNNWREV
jgi:hypothetical protein